MAKKIAGYIKLEIPAGQANPSPPVGPALGQRGLNIMEFCKAFNAATQNLEAGMPIPVVITAYSDRSFSFETKTPPAAFLLRKAAGIKKGSAVPNRDKVGKVTVFTTKLEYRPIIHEIRSQKFEAVGHLPASTLAVVTSLADPEWLVEIEAVAMAG